MKKTISLVLLLVFCLSLAGCGGSTEPDPNAGTYTAQSAKAMGITINVEELWENGVSFTLEDNGKCTVNLDGEEFNRIKWTLTDGVFHAEGGGAEFDGTLADGVMVLENVMDSGMTLTLINPDCVTYNASSADEADVALAGWWVSNAMEVEGARVEGEALADMVGAAAEEVMALELSEDGSALISAMGEVAPGLWLETEDGVELRLDEETEFAVCTLKGGELRMELDEGVLLLIKTDECPAVFAG